MLWQERSLFEYWVEIVPIEDLAIHQETMRRYPDNVTAKYAHRVRASEWLKANQPFRRYVLSELKLRGPLRSREIENRVGMHWSSGGWTNDPGRHVGLMLDVLWMKGEVMIVGRDGQQRIWDLASRTLPVVPRLPQREVARRLLEGQLRARGVADIKQFGWAFDGRHPGWERALRELVREGIAVPAEVEGMAGGSLCARRSVGAKVQPADRCALAVRRSDLGQGSHPPIVRLLLPHRDLRSRRPSGSSGTSSCPSFTATG